MKFGVDQTTEMLRQTPATLSSMLGGLSPAWTRSRNDRKDWSPYDIVGHLIQAEETNWVPRAEIILSRGKDRRFPLFDRVGYFHRTKGRPLPDLLKEFSKQRKASIKKIASWQLTSKELALTGVHPEFGKVTLRQLLATWTVHDLGHIRQIVTYLANEHADNVGPWKEYLSILRK
ncbi:MAG: DinB family protein [Acidobacteriota bacterium]